MRQAYLHPHVTQVRKRPKLADWREYIMVEKGTTNHLAMGNMATDHV